MINLALRSFHLSLSYTVTSQELQSKRQQSKIIGGTFPLFEHTKRLSIAIQPCLEMNILMENIRSLNEGVSLASY